MVDLESLFNPLHIGLSQTHLTKEGLLKEVLSWTVRVQDCVLGLQREYREE